MPPPSVTCPQIDTPVLPRGRVDLFTCLIFMLANPAHTQSYPHMPTKHTVLQGDAADQMRQYDDHFVDCIVTSPPYNLGKDYGDVSDAMSRGDYLTTFTPGWMTEAKRLLKDEGSLFLNLGASPADPLLPHQVVLAAVELGWVLQNTFHWVKSISFKDVKGTLRAVADDGEEATEGRISTSGHFKPINSKRFVNDCHEYVFHLTKDGNRDLDRKAVGVGVPYSDPSNIARWAHTGGDNLRCGGNTWLIPYATIQSATLQRPHPATFPVALAEKCLRIAGKPKVVLDPFAGIGTTSVAAERCEAEWAISIDLNKSYVHEAAYRLKTKAHYS